MNPFQLKVSQSRVGSILIAIVMLMSFGVKAQDKKAKELLDEVTTKIKSYDNIVIDFKY